MSQEVGASGSPRWRRFWSGLSKGRGSDSIPESYKSVFLNSAQHLAGEATGNQEGGTTRRPESGASRFLVRGGTSQLLRRVEGITPTSNPYNSATDTA